MLRAVTHHLAWGPDCNSVLMKFVSLIANASNVIQTFLELIAPFLILIKIVQCYFEIGYVFQFSSIEKSSMYYFWLTMDKLIKIQLKLLRENKCILEYTHDSTPIPTNTNQQVSIQLSSMIYDGVENIVHCMQFIA